MSYEIYRIGRNSDMDIKIDDASVSGVHAELIKTRDGTYFFTDCGSTNGSFVARNRDWVPIRQGFVRATEKIRLGGYPTTAPKLIDLAGR